VPRDVLALLGLGSGMNNIPDKTLRKLWHTWREPVTREWQARFGQEPFVAWLAREEGWDDEAEDE
jgi:hypothetical protein